MRKICFVGEKVRYVTKRDPYTGNALRDQYGLEVKEIDYDHENKRDVAIEGVSIYQITRQDPIRPSKEYIWGPAIESFVQDVRDEDWSLIQNSRHGVNFVDVTDQPDWKARYFRNVDDIAAEG